MKQINFWIELKNRWNAESPIFFIKLQNFGLWCTGVSTTVATLGVIPFFGLPELLPKIAAAFAIAGALIGAVAKLGVKHPNYDTLDKKE
jgi:hypothetical protein